MNMLARSFVLKRGLQVSRTNRVNFISTNAEEQIVLPNRIERGPTDILNALNQRVEIDLDAAHFKYHDDPFLTPSSNILKRTYAMAQESGRKSARWILENDSKFFQHSVANPPISGFFPPIVFSEESNIEEADLIRLIKNVDVTGCIDLYGLFKTKGVELSEVFKKDLLQLLCFYNHEDNIKEEWIEERWFQDNLNAQDKPRKIWKDGELAEKIFAELEHKDSVSYCSLIRGMAKFSQAKRAYALFQEALDTNIPLDANTFNHILAIVKLLKDTPEARWELVTHTLRLMSEQNIKPNLGTLNAVLQNLSFMSSFKHSREYALQILAEFKKIGVEPSLASYHFILHTFCKDRGPVSHILVDILNHLQGQSLVIRDVRDVLFFVKAMEVCRNHLNDINIARKVDAFLHMGNNYNLIGGTYKETIYYRHFLALMLSSEPLEVFMETYNRLVPNIYTVEPAIMSEILRVVDMNGAIDLLPIFWSHIVQFDYVGRENLLTQVLEVMVTNIPDSPELMEKFNFIASDMYQRLIDSQELKPDQLRLSGDILGSILQILSRGESFEKAAEVFRKIDQNENELIGEPSPEAMTKFINLCIKEKQPTLAIDVLEYMVRNGYSEAQLAGDEIVGSFTLDEEQRAKALRLLKSN